jgi:hypothetical protein
MHLLELAIAASSLLPLVALLVVLASMIQQPIKQSIRRCTSTNRGGAGCTRAPGGRAEQEPVQGLRHGPLPARAREGHVQGLLNASPVAEGRVEESVQGLLNASKAADDNPQPGGGGGGGPPPMGAPGGTPQQG